MAHSTRAVLIFAMNQSYDSMIISELQVRLSINCQMITLTLLIILLTGEFRVHFTEIAIPLATTDNKKKLDSTSTSSAIQIEDEASYLKWLSSEDDDVMYREDLFEGDIVLSSNDTIAANRIPPMIWNTACCKSSSNFSVPQLEMLAIQHNAVRQKTLLWPNGRVPYVISPAYSNNSKLIIMEAFKEYRRLTCVRFVPKKLFDFNYIYIAPNDGCYSMIGNNGGRQEVSLGDGCLKKGVVIHELMHALGFFHEQNRADRDLYVNILWENIKPSLVEQFDKYSAAIIDDLGSPYDYDSVMHYSARAFSKNGKPTILPKSIDKIIKIGQRRGLSPIDVWKINKLYNCNKKISVKSDSNIQNLINGEQFKEQEMQGSVPITVQFATTIGDATVSSMLSTRSTVTITSTSNNDNSTGTTDIQGVDLEKMRYCSDRHPYCKILKTLLKNFCVIYSRFVQDYCAYTCGKC
ncbi:shTK domain protein [Onchocerca flexuosa]|uniref:Metalloendopeptidase n=2 Tax=Onchocerca flexuosa TaxID=387005 RepID=A0A238C5G8_9BILA|nr:shTK domain protein [Onchocerca flexuosa]